MSLGDFAYCETRRVSYGEDGATFVPVTCRRCGRVGMPFEGYY